MTPTPFHLLAIYAKLPTIECKGLCHESCGPIHATTIELERMQVAASQLVPPTRVPQRMIKNPGPMVRGPGQQTMDHHGVLIINAQTHVCPMLDTTTHRCKIYEARPLICRTFGVAKGLECPYGCKPTNGRYLSKEEFFDLVQALEDVNIKLSTSHR